MKDPALARLAERPRSAADLPVVVIAGRPNVGKSTLLNRIVGGRVAIVEEQPGVTRDRLELVADWRGRAFTLVDTGGVLERGGELDRKVTAQALRAVEGADVVLLVLDATTGLTAQDEAVARLLRRHAPRVIPVANKVDSGGQEPLAFELARLGFGEPALVSALHGRGVGDLLDRVVERFEPARARLADRTALEPLGAVAIVGRPNVGKSTLFNRLVGDERAVVHDVPGTTRDAIDTVVETDAGPLRFVDTAGLRRKARIVEGTEYYALVRSLAAIDRADVALLVLDAAEGVTHQDQRLAERVDASGSPILVVVNKWDLASTDRRLALAREVEDQLGFLAYAPVLRVSAKTGFGVQRIVPALRRAIDAYRRRVPTAELNEAVHSLQATQPPPRARILYAVQGAVEPPTFTLFATGKLPPAYLRYLERSLRERFELGPTPLKLRVRRRGR
ncbi:MAG TPA: ribosome biogenesis GTPase Der [Acidimicrobiales bacterium]|jgi:GTP-binding protein|nr:ribosome biogenesis GTPase Der [Acidimicrobiales bacterium]